MRARPGWANKEKARAKAMSNSELFKEALETCAQAASELADRNDEISADVFEIELRRRLTAWLNQ